MSTEFRNAFRQYIFGRTSLDVFTLQPILVKVTAKNQANIKTTTNVSESEHQAINVNGSKF